ncbi:UNVERIFIED_CONTAM: hypothetical protein RMT77_005517 [Armadillidium vulgare]
MKFSYVFIICFAMAYFVDASSDSSSLSHKCPFAVCNFKDFDKCSKCLYEVLKKHLGANIAEECKEGIPSICKLTSGNCSQ